MRCFPAWFTSKSWSMFQSDPGYTTPNVLSMTMQFSFVLLQKSSFWNCRSQPVLTKPQGTRAQSCSAITPGTKGSSSAAQSLIPLASQLGVWPWESYWPSPSLIFLSECPLFWPCGCHLETAFLGFGERAGFLSSYLISFLVFPSYLSTLPYLISFLDLLEFHDFILFSPFPIFSQGSLLPFWSPFWLLPNSSAQSFDIYCACAQ